MPHLMELGRDVGWLVVDEVAGLSVVVVDVEVDFNGSTGGSGVTLGFFVSSF